MKLRWGKKTLDFETDPDDQLFVRLPRGFDITLYYFKQYIGEVPAWYAALSSPDWHLEMSACETPQKALSALRKEIKKLQKII